MGIKSRNCEKPPKNWGPGVIPLTASFFISGTYPNNVTHTWFTGAYLPFDFTVHAWAYGWGATTGGVAPTIEFGIQLQKADISATDFAADLALTATACTTASAGFTNLNANPVRRVRTAAANGWVVFKAELVPGAAAITAFPGATLSLWVMPLEGGIAALS